MRIEEFNDKREVTLLAGLLYDRSVLGRIASKWDGHLFYHPMANTLTQLAVEYYTKHEKAPGQDIEGLFRLWAEASPVEENIRAGEKLLHQAAEEYERSAKNYNPEHVLDIAGEHFNRVRLENLTGRIDSNLKLGKVKEAWEVWEMGRRVEMGVGSGENLIQDKEQVFSLFERQDEPLITYPGAMGRFFGPVLGRDRFVTFLAPEKTGKSFWLLDLAWRAVTKHRLRVAYFECGDDPEETRMRFMVRAGKCPDSTSDGEPFPATIKWPTAILPPLQRGEQARLKTKDVTFKKRLDAARAWRGCQRIQADLKSNTDFLKLSCHPAKSVSVSGICSILKSWELEGWHPDAVIIDYADLLAPGNSKVDVLQQDDDTWAALRALSQREHVLVASATQTNREGYKARWLEKSHVGGSKRKLAHCSCCVGINVFGQEKDDQTYRLNWVARRKGATNRFVYAAACLALANPCVKSCFPEKYET